MPAERVAALRKAFDALMQDKAFLADAEKRKLSIDPIRCGKGPCAGQQDRVRLAGAGDAGEEGDRAGELITAANTIKGETTCRCRSNSGASPALSHADKLAAQWTDFLLLAGRLLMGWIFVSSGWGKADEHPGVRRHDPAPRPAEIPRLYRAPVEFIGGVLIVLGFATRYTALVMLLFVIIASFSSHRYWAVRAGAARNQSGHFWKNITIKGGLVLLFITGAGRFALDWMLAKKR